MAPGLFLGWRIDPGMRYRNVARVMDYADFREKRNVNVIDVPEPELFIEEGPPVLPVANATQVFSRRVYSRECCQARTAGLSPL